MSETNIYKIAFRKKLRFDTFRGIIDVEDLFDLTLQDLDKIASTIADKIESTSKSSVFENKQVDSEAQLAYDIVADVFKTKQDEAKEKTLAEAKRQKRARIQELIQRKKESAMEELDIEQLEALLAEE